MSTQRYISTSFWTDKWIRTLDPSERYLYMYLLTNPQTNIAGIYQITIDRIAFDTGYDERTLLPMLDRFRKMNKACFVFDEWIILPSWTKHQKWESKDTIKKGIESTLKSIPQKVLHEANGIGYQYPIDTLLIGYVYQPSYLDSDTNTDSDTNIDLDIITPKKSANPTKKKLNPNEYSQEFENFWDAYPKREGKKGAYKVFNALLKNGKELTYVVDMLNIYKKRIEALGTKYEYIRLPATFLGNIEDYESGFIPERSNSKPSLKVNQRTTMLDLEE